MGFALLWGHFKLVDVLSPSPADARSSFPPLIAAALLSPNRTANQAPREEAHIGSEPSISPRYWLGNYPQHPASVDRSIRLHWNRKSSVLVYPAVVVIHANALLRAEVVDPQSPGIATASISSAGDMLRVSFGL